MPLEQFYPENYFDDYFIPPKNEKPKNKQAKIVFFVKRDYRDRIIKFVQKLYKRFF